MKLVPDFMVPICRTTRSATRRPPDLDHQGVSESPVRLRGPECRVMLLAAPSGSGGAPSHRISPDLTRSQQGAARGAPPTRVQLDNDQVTVDARRDRHLP